MNPPIPTPPIHRRPYWMGNRSLGWSAALATLIGLASALLQANAVESVPDPTEPVVLTRGPVHEAFAGLVTLNPMPGIAISKAPPAAIAEIPPETRPEGEGVAWIPGYWGWDDERMDFVWVSGTWRVLPPGRAWIVGYWTKNDSGYQWISGYWANAVSKDVLYLPAPPATLENGPNVIAPSDEYGWTPGSWVWRTGQYQWSPGFWLAGRVDWNWIPSHYLWTPRGHLFVSGFWDYPVGRRGVLFAPVYFGISPRRPYVRFSPSIVIVPGLLAEHLFLRPRFAHYYFGDYYALGYGQSGYFASYSYQTDRHGYDPIYAHRRWEHRREANWERGVASSFEGRRGHEESRPARTWKGQAEREGKQSEGRGRADALGESLDRATHRPDGNLRLRTAAKGELKTAGKTGQALQRTQEQRRSIESKVPNRALPRSATRTEPIKAPMPRSPIASRPASKPNTRPAPPAPAPEVREPVGRQESPAAPRPRNARPH